MSGFLKNLRDFVRSEAESGKRAKSEAVEAKKRKAKAEVERVTKQRTMEKELIKRAKKLRHFLEDINHIYLKGRGKIEANDWGSIELNWDRWDNASKERWSSGRVTRWGGSRLTLTATENNCVVVRGGDGEGEAISLDKPSWEEAIGAAIVEILKSKHFYWDYEEPEDNTP